MKFRQWLRRIVPDPRRPYPHPWTDWVPLGLVVVLVAVLGVGVLERQTIQHLVTCKDGFQISTATWKAGNRCVGLSEGSYDFGVDGIGPVMRLIDRQNRAADKDCPGTPVTVGVLATLTDRFAGARAIPELEGMAVGQRIANGTGCLHPMHLVVGQLGDYFGSGDALAVARELADRGEVVAVAGVGLSFQTTADVIDLLAAHKIPVVSDVVTAEGFDQTGSRADNPGYDGCDPDSTYRTGVGRDYYYRIAFRMFAQIRALGTVIGTRPDFVMVPTGGSDPYTCTALPLLHRQFGADMPEVKFDAGEPSTVTQTAKRVCAVAKDVTVAYLARGRDLSRFLYGLDDAITNGQCAAATVTVVSTSDGDRLRATESDPVLEDLRSKALGSPSFADGRIRLLSSLIAGADRGGPNNPAFDGYQRAFADAGLDPGHATDGWAVNAHDAVTTVSTALRALPQNKTVSRADVNTTISGFSSPDQSVPGAGGPITFDNSGNRTGPGPSVVRVCPVRAGGDRKVNVVGVLAVPGQPYPDCPH
ncbi:ABC transporter substrate-binding protein [Nocardia terpenica]|uniref:ABC transporter substrate-binding protein n=1 Tax=Nocardia terpenica TaxID=455432 RepID=UPI001E3D9643|nr:ABC transporter substrate-binding protein [Nocardia terpenica]